MKTSTLNISLKINRLCKRFTVKEIAKRVGVSEVYLNQIEAGRTPSVKIQNRIAQILGVSRKILFNGTAQEV